MNSEQEIHNNININLLGGRVITRQVYFRRSNFIILLLLFRYSLKKTKQRCLLISSWQSVFIILSYLYRRYILSVTLCCIVINPPMIIVWPLHCYQSTCSSIFLTQTWLTLNCFPILTRFGPFIILNFL